VRSEYRVLIFCLTLFVGVPLLYALGERLGGMRLAILLPAVASIATGVYARMGDRPQPPAGARPY